MSGFHCFTAFVYRSSAIERGCNGCPAFFASFYLQSNFSNKLVNLRIVFLQVGLLRGNSNLYKHASADQEKYVG